ncbi:hypothetical protein [Cylindrospermopsis raciborskii]|uniref:Uncharacterized protein n=2 Tax=Cylindrospermopsis raciborskii TaxID=77022 RepID=A0A9Q5R001_9CYAN|nr:hypothetical protein [Cylindrospermopsis raciborskii]OHY33026.1 hypothetical protein BCV64_11100 [Cylindrospermopsis raciborskii MVCC14]OPH11269.1 hypothetical protein CENA302_01095 [Cylindrospermopsis raciborskii CENA302]
MLNWKRAILRSEYFVNALLPPSQFSLENAGRFHSPKLRSPEPFYHQCLGWFLILINPKLRKKAAIAVWKRVFKKSFCILQFTTDFENALLKKGAFRLNMMYKNIYIVKSVNV